MSLGKAIKNLPSMGLAGLAGIGVGTLIENVPVATEKPKNLSLTLMAVGIIIFIGFIAYLLISSKELIK